MDHQARLEAVRAAVRARPKHMQLTVRKKRQGHTPHDYGYKQGKHEVDVTRLDRILEIDRESHTLVAEGEVTTAELCAATLPLGLIPAVVPELETFTVAGLINGLGIESSSHRHGIFPMNVPSFEVVLGNGDVLEVDEHNYTDLYAALPGSYGTFGIVTKATIYLIEAKPYVRSRYRHFEHVSAYVQAYAQALDRDDFVEGLVMGPNSHVLVTGNFSDSTPGLRTYHAARHGNLWYYEHAAKMALRDAEDQVPIYEYVFRHMRSLMWSSRFANVLHLPMTRLGRWITDRAISSAVRKRGLSFDLPHLRRERSLVMQDAAVTLRRLEEAIEYAKRNFGIYPIWNCAAGRAPRGAYSPGKTLEMLFLINQHWSPERRREVERADRYVIDVGIYGEPGVPNFRHHEAIRALQKFVDIPAMWGVCYLSKDEFEQLWDIRSYEALRQKYHADQAFPHIQEKVLAATTADSEHGPEQFWRLTALYNHFKNQRRITQR